MIHIPVPLSVSVPRDAYRYWPQNEDVCSGTGKKSVRYIFEYQKLTNFENEKLSRLLKEIINGMIEGLKVPDDWSKNHLLRFCYGTGWKTRNSVKALKAYLEWRYGTIPSGYQCLYPKITNLLVSSIQNSGVFYIHGRDCKYRPLIVMNFYKINFKENTIDDYINLLCFLLEYVIDKMLLPGQIENWVTLMDLGKTGLGNLSVSSLKHVLQLLQTNYRCRLGVSFIVNPPKSIWIMWSCIKPFLDEVTIDKIKISKSSYSQDMLNMFNPSQVEEKYGGKAKNLNSYWPPTVPEKDFSLESKPIALSTKDSYYNYHPEDIIFKQEVIENDETIINIKSRVNSLDVSADKSDISINDLCNDKFARSDVENQEENLIDLELVSPFNRKSERNPTFASSAKKIALELQKQMSFKSITIGNKENKPDPAESIDFEPDYSDNLTSLRTLDQALIGNKGQELEGIIIENSSTSCSCKQVQCSFKDTCNIV